MPPTSGIQLLTSLPSFSWFFGATATSEFWPASSSTTATAAASTPADQHAAGALMSEVAVPREAIARVDSHIKSKVTGLVQQLQSRPVLTEGTAVMETLFELPAVRKRSPDEE